MGRSDPSVFSFYANTLGHESFKTKYRNIAFFGFSKENNFTKWLKSSERDFYDLGLDNWEINKFPYTVEKSYDLIVCTRCAYFCKDIDQMMNEFYSILNPGGRILVDWGLGDHWRFEKYKVGWVKDEEHEWSYDKENYLWSTIWDDSFLNSRDVKDFQSNIRNKGYNCLKTAIIDEVPVVRDLEMFSSFDSITVNFLSLWPESPQLYLAVVADKGK